MEWPNVGDRLALDSGCWAVRVKLQKEGPVAASPLEQPFRMSRLGREVEVIASRRYLRKEVAVQSIDLLARLRSSAKALKCFSRRLVRKKFTDIGRGHAPLVRSPMCCLGQIESLTSGSDDEQPLAVLRHAIIGGVEDSVGDPVASFLES